MPPVIDSRTNLPRWISHFWILVPALAAGWLIWTTVVRIRHIEVISDISREVLVADPSTPTGYADGLRRMVPPERVIESSRWIIETQEMVHQGNWRLRHLDLDNAPDGRAVRTQSAYRWWLAGLAWLDHLLSGSTFGESVERAALYADPVLHLLLLVSLSVLIASRYGPLPAAVAAVALVGFFPLAGSFQPGIPADLGIALACLLWSVLPITSGLHTLQAPKPESIDGPNAGRIASRNRITRKSFFAAGIFGGLGLWIDLPGQSLVLAGLGIGGILAAWRRHRRAEGSPFDEALVIPWRAWAVGGAIATCAAYLLERYPGELSWLPTDGVHWIHALGWLALGELLKRADDWGRAGQWPREPRGIGLTTAAAAILAGTLLLLAYRPGIEPFVGGLSSWRMTSLPGSPVADSFQSWLHRNGFSAMLRATLVPLLILIPALWIIPRDRSSDNRRLVLVLLMGPLVLLIALASLQLRVWNAVDAMLLVVLIVVVTPARGRDRIPTGKWSISMSFLAALLFAPGLLLLHVRTGYANPKELNQTEAEFVVERNLAHWLARRAGPEGVTVLAAPQLTASLAYYGSLRGLGTLHPENNDGVAAAIRIASSTSNMESQALLEKRGVTHVIIPSWDSGLTDYARIGSGVPSGTFVALLNRWELPPTIRPVVYPMPRIPGWEGQAVTVFEVVEEQDPADALSRLAEYFIEMGEIERATAYRTELGNFPASLGAIAALGQIAMAKGDTAAFSSVMDLAVPYTEGGAARSMPWDRRVSLAIVLTQGKQRELAREQVEACLKRTTEANLRSLTPSSLFRFLLLCRMFNLEIPDPDLGAKARSMVPPDLRERL
ncbi:MAG: hypothetical protein R3F07_09340 [Opitutaceae bacterium]